MSTRTLIRHRLHGPLSAKVLKANPVANGHVIMLPHDCTREHADYNSCPICHWAFGICKNCGNVEVELEVPCEKVPVDYRARYLVEKAAHDEALAAYNDAVWDKAKFTCGTPKTPCAPCNMLARLELAVEGVLEPVQPWNSDPVRQEDGGWWFYEETWADRHGPFLSEAETRAHLKVYVETYLEGPTQKQEAA